MATAYLTGSVYRAELPILLVSHDKDGSWQFLDGGHIDTDDGVAVHAEHVFDEHPELQTLVDLPVGWAAERPTVGAAWKRYELPDSWG